MILSCSPSLNWFPVNLSASQFSCITHSMISVFTEAHLVSVKIILYWFLKIVYTFESCQMKGLTIAFHILTRSFHTAMKIVIGNKLYMWAMYLFSALFLWWPYSNLQKRICLAEFEKTLVPWVKDADVPFCPTCGDKFNVARRRHHCRLCGSIMCTKCSMFIPFELAGKLLLIIAFFYDRKSALNSYSSPKNDSLVLKSYKIQKKIMLAWRVVVVIVYSYWFSGSHALLRWLARFHPWNNGGLHTIFQKQKIQ